MHYDHKTPNKCHVKSLPQIINNEANKDTFEKKSDYFLTKLYSLGAMEHDPKFSVKVFSLLIIHLWDAHSDIQGVCGILTLEQFEESKMGANKAVSI